MSALTEKPNIHILAVPKTGDPLFRTIEEVHYSRGLRWGNVLDAGTGGHSLKWLASLPKETVSKIVAVSADLSSGEGRGAKELRSVLDTARGDVLIEGAWCVASRVPALPERRFDTIVCDYLLGSMDGFTPFEQNTLFAQLEPLLSDEGVVHIVGLAPIYALLGDAGYARLSEAQRLVVDTARLRDACILLAQHRPYREFPPSWVHRELARSGLEPISTLKTWGVLWKHATVKKQLDVARRKLPHFGDDALAAAMAAKIDALDKKARELLTGEGVAYGYDYVISAARKRDDDAASETATIAPTE